METFFIWLVIAAIAFGKWLMERGGTLAEPQDDEREKNSSPTASSSALPRAGRTDAQSEEERLRKFMEALGIPPTSAPPRKVAPRASKSASPPLTPVHPPPVLLPRSLTKKLQSPRPSQREVVAPAPRSSVAQQTAPAETFSASERDQTYKTSDLPPLPSIPAATISPASSESLPREIGAASALQSTFNENADIRLRLRSAAQLREAFILREILGPPRGMKDLSELAIGADPITF